MPEVPTPFACGGDCICRAHCVVGNAVCAHSVALVYLWPQWKVYLGAAGLMACVVVLALSKRKQFKRLPAWGAVIAREPIARALPASAKAAALPVVIAEKPEAQVATAPSEAPRLLR